MTSRLPPRRERGEDGVDDLLEREVGRIDLHRAVGLLAYDEGQSPVIEYGGISPDFTPKKHSQNPKCTKG